ncbi:hypothetical protein E2C01_018136 [Portunus trituberculatus]|uniref:Uncharacterized protein n=1 Tax=Portunus trituberculatus TaxID=210409 RepID=A0A5B7DUA7_PORTR|nr:hypothetical protein [Portunus trituberculatus]
MIVPKTSSFYCVRSPVFCRGFSILLLFRHGLALPEWRSQKITRAASFSARVQRKNGPSRVGRRQHLARSSGGAWLNIHGTWRAVGVARAGRAPEGDEGTAKATQEPSRNVNKGWRDDEYHMVKTRAGKVTQK